MIEGFSGNWILPAEKGAPHAATDTVVVGRVARGHECRAGACHPWFSQETTDVHAGRANGTGAELFVQDSARNTVGVLALLRNTMGVLGELGWWVSSLCPLSVGVLALSPFDGCPRFDVLALMVKAGATHVAAREIAQVILFALRGGFGLPWAARSSTMGPCDFTPKQHGCRNPERQGHVTD